MFLALAPPAKTILVPASVIKVEPILKIHTAFGFPPAFNVNIPLAPVPEIPLVEEFTYNPGANVNPPSCPGSEIASSERA
jgi:hypothetical protein